MNDESTSLDACPHDLQVYLFNFLSEDGLRNLVIASPWFSRGTFYFEALERYWIAHINRAWCQRGGFPEACSEPPEARVPESLAIDHNLWARSKGRNPHRGAAADEATAAAAAGGGSGFDGAASACSSHRPPARDRANAALRAYACLPPQWPRRWDESKLSPIEAHRIRVDWGGPPPGNWQSQQGAVAAYCGDDPGGDRCVAAECGFPPLLSAPWTTVRFGAAAPKSPSTHPGAESASSAQPASPGPKPGLGAGVAGRVGLSYASYFEIDVLKPAKSAGWAPFGEEDKCVAVGLARESFKLVGKQPGWTSGSWGYHGDDGNLYHGSGGAAEAVSQRFGPGDTVGCGAILVPDPMFPIVAVFFTRNGEVVKPAAPPYLAMVREGQCSPEQCLTLQAHERGMGVAFSFLDNPLFGREPLVPVVGLDSPCPVRLRMGGSPLEAFEFPLQRLNQIDAHCEAQANAPPVPPRARAAASGPSPPGTS